MSWTLDLSCYKCRCIWAHNAPYTVHAAKLQASKNSRVAGFNITSLWLLCQRVAQRHRLIHRFSNQGWFCWKRKWSTARASQLDHHVLTLYKVWRYHKQCLKKQFLRHTTKIVSALKGSNGWWLKRKKWMLFWILWNELCNKLCNSQQYPVISILLLHDVTHSSTLSYPSHSYMM
jgi:hypothetical protein